MKNPVRPQVGCIYTLALLTRGRSGIYRRKLVFVYETEREMRKKKQILKQKCQVQSVVLKKLNLFWFFFPSLGKDSC